MIVRVNVVLNMTTLAVVIFRVKVSCIMTVDGIIQSKAVTEQAIKEAILFIDVLCKMRCRIIAQMHPPSTPPIHPWHSPSPFLVPNLFSLFQIEAILTWPTYHNP